MEYIKVDS